MSLSSEGLRLFNSDTMSGVFAGTRPQDYRRLRLGSTSDPSAALRWYELHFYANPQSITLVRYPEPENGHPVSLRSVAENPMKRVIDSLQIELAVHGLWLHACGNCHHWIQSTSIDSSEEPAGHCLWGAQEAEMKQIPVTLTQQSALSPGCAHWQKIEKPLPPQIQPVLGSATVDDRTRADVAPQRAQSKRSLREIWNDWRSRIGSTGMNLPHATDWDRRVQELSTGQAGTEPCPTCPGRLSNLGALTLETLDGDAQTFSIWRCRTCFTILLNSWIDRWQRLDTLEIEESYYRLAPQEAFQILGLFDPISAPDSKGDRRQHIDAILQLINTQQPLASQTKRGR